MHMNGSSPTDVLKLFLDNWGKHLPNTWCDRQSSFLLLQSIVGIAGGATRAALVQHQARRDNMADVAAKDSSQVGQIDS